jgi:hypothetical protein
VVAVAAKKTLAAMKLARVGDTALNQVRGRQAITVSMGLGHPGLTGSQTLMRSAGW